MTSRHWLDKFWGRASRRPIGTRKPARTRTRLRCEDLEPRTLLTGSWTALANGPSTGGLMMLLSDGTVAVHNDYISGNNNWYRLTPNASGSYVNGAWSPLASMNAGRTDFPSNVLPDGRVFALGGEYNINFNQAELNTGEIYNPVANTWTNIPNFPQSVFGDDPTEVLPNGTILAGYQQGPQTYIYNPWTNTWTQTGSRLYNDPSSEESWVKLPDGSILSYDVQGTNARAAQRYVPSSGTWVAAGTSPVELGSNGGGNIVPELGPGLLLPDGRALLLGASGNTAYYTPSTNSWTAGPVIPNGLGAFDAPGAVLPNGKVLLAASNIDGINFSGPTKIFELDPTTNTYADVTPSGVINTSGGAYPDRMLVLPTGQLLVTDSITQFAVYTPDGAASAAWKPTITGITTNADGSFTLSGTQLNGLGEGAGYGDDDEMSTNYPIVQLTDASNHVSYARTYNWSSTGVATGNTPEITHFKPPAGLNAVSVRVIANGIASDPFTFNLAAATQLSVVPSVQAVLPGTPFSVTVTAEDAAGHPAGYLGPMHFSSSDPQASLPADYTFTAADHGMHTFSGVVLRNTGSQTITAGNGGLGSVTEFSIPTAGSQPNGITAGPDGNPWFVEGSGNKVGRITPTGTVTEFAIPTANGTPSGITAGPDGNLWFTEDNGNKVGKITPAGAITEFSIPTSGSHPAGITAGPDGNLWFVEGSGNKVGRITPTGTVTEFTIPTSGSGLNGITMGPDGNLWFVEEFGNKVGKITPAGTVTEFSIPTVLSEPVGITAGPDGNLWFTEFNSNKVGKITPAGAVAEFSIPTGNSHPAGITAGFDGNLWFVEELGNKVGRITPTGAVTESSIPTGSSFPSRIAAGPDRNLWFTEFSGNKVGRITSATLTGSAPVAVVGPATHYTVTTTAPNPDEAGTYFNVTVTAQDDHGFTALGYRGTVHFTSSDPQAILPADYSFSPADNGVHTFMLSTRLQTAGTQSITATDTVTGSIMGSAAVNVVAAAASQFAVSTDAANPDIAGTPFDVTVTAQDRYGNTATSYRGTVHFRSGDPYGASLPADYTFQASDQGQVTFSGVTALYTAGTWDVTATDTQSGITGSATVNVVAAALARFAVATSAANPDVAGTPFDVTVTAQDAYGNTIPSYTGMVTFSSADPYGASLPADYTFQPSDQGVHTFHAGATLFTAGATTADFANGFGDPSNLAANGNTTFPGTPPVLRLSDDGGGEASSAWYNRPVGAGAFTTTFTLQDQPVSGAADGVCFVLQADPRGQAVLGLAGGGEGYAGIVNSIAVKFDLYTHGSHSPSTGLFTGGQSPDSDPSKDVSLTGINLGSDDPIQVTLSYDGAVTLTETVTDTVTQAVFTHSYALNLAQVLGTGVAYAGFTGGTGGESAVQDIVSWTGSFHVNTWDVTATDAQSGITGAAYITVQAAPAAQFVVTTDAADPDSAGTAFDVTVVATDPYGNTVTGYGGTVTFSSQDPYGATLPADYTFQPSDQGVAIFFGLTALYTAGTWDITATDTSSGITGAALVNVQAAPAVALQVVAPASAMSGMAFDVTVIAVDPYGNTDTNYQGTVTFSSSDTDPDVVLPPDYTFQAADAGMATFPGGVTLLTPGDQTLTATDTQSGITGASTVTVTAGGNAPTTARFGSEVAAARQGLPAAPAGRPPDAHHRAGTAGRAAASTEGESSSLRAESVGGAAPGAALADHVWSDPADLLLTGAWLDGLAWNEQR